MRRIKLTRQEKALEDALARGEYVSAGKEEFQRIAAILEARKKDTVLHIRINSRDLNNIKTKAQKLGIKYQTFISEVLHRIAM
jgi:predicted DNA binding CopG/RHH family protein